MRPHSTTSSSWHLVEKLDQVSALMKKELVCTIEGCPYEINLEIVLTMNELEELGFHNDTEEHIAYSLQMREPEKEMQVQFKLWDYIQQIHTVMDRQDTSYWGVAEWDKACPFLFECDPAFVPDPEEELQKERETWT